MTNRFVPEVGAGAADVVATLPLPAGVTFLSADAPCERSGMLVTCAFGNIAAVGGSRSAEIRVRPDVGGTTLITTIEATTASTDPVPGNNAATVSVVVTGGGVREYWIVEYDTGDVRRYNAASNSALTGIDLASGIRDIAFSPDGERAFATLSGGGVAVIDTKTTQLLSTLSVSSPNAAAVSPNGARLYVSTDDNTVVVFDAVSGAHVETIGVGDEPAGLAVTPDAKYVLVANRTSDSVSVIDTLSNTVIGTIALASGDFPIEVAIAPNGKRAYVTTYFGATVYVIDVATRAVVTTMSVYAGPIGIAIGPDGKRAYVASFDADTVNVIDLAANTVIATISISGSPQGVAVSPDGNLLYVTLFNADELAVIDLATHEVVTTVDGGEAPVSVKYLRRRP